MQAYTLHLLPFICDRFGCEIWQLSNQNHAIDRSSFSAQPSEDDGNDGMGHRFRSAALHRIGFRTSHQWIYSYTFLNPETSD